MQNSTPAQQPRPKLTIMYFTKIALEQLKGKIPVILLVLALLALPAALVNAYSAGNMLSSVSRLLERYDLSSPGKRAGLPARFKRRPSCYGLCGHSPLVYLPASFLRRDNGGRSIYI